jgi:hypothetical protein
MSNWPNNVLTTTIGDEYIDCTSMDNTYDTITIDSNTLASSAWNFSYNQPTSLSILKADGNELLKIDQTDGTVTWASGINIDEAAKALAKSISLGAEMKAGITNRVKSEIRDTVFSNLIEIARDKGGLSVEDIEYFHRASKIMDKLKDTGV